MNFSPLIFIIKSYSFIHKMPPSPIILKQKRKNINLLKPRSILETSTASVILLNRFVSWFLILLRVRSQLILIKRMTKRVICLYMLYRIPLFYGLFFITTIHLYCLVIWFFFMWLCFFIMGKWHIASRHKSQGLSDRKIRKFCDLQEIATYTFCHYIHSDNFFLKHTAANLVNELFSFCLVI